MCKFKVGDIIVGNAKASRYAWTTVGTKCEVVKSVSETGDGVIAARVIDAPSYRQGPYNVDPDCFDLVRTPHVHADIIHQWAEGYPIEFKGPWDTKWYNFSSDCPDFYKDYEYRVKPDKTPAQIEKEEIEEEMGKLKERLSKLEVE